jgi:predicted metal-dependent hydrolase
VHWDGVLPGQLLLSLPPQADGAQWRDAVLAWLQRQALSHFQARLGHYAPLLGVQWQQLKLSSAQSRWGSADARGVIRLNWRLMHAPPELIDYVVVHELSHLREMNHSPKFWAVVAQAMPDYAQRVRDLHAWLAPPW